MLLSRYGDMHYILSLSVKRAGKLYKKAVHKKRREETYQLWLARYPGYTKDNFETFDEFYDKLYPPVVELDTRSKDEIMNELLGKEE